MADVTEPILSVGYLCENVIETRLARSPFLKHGERNEPLTMERDVYFVKTQFAHDAMGAVESCGAKTKDHKIHVYELEDHTLH